MTETARLLAVYAGSAGLVLILLRRFVAPVSRRAALLLALLPLTVTGSAMFTGRHWGALNLSYAQAPLWVDGDRLPRPREEIANGILSDLVHEVVPSRKAVRENVKNGRLPLFSRFNRCGEPLLASAQPAPFHPGVWLGFLLPLSTATTFGCTFVLLLAVSFAFAFFRELAFAETVALFGASTWMLSGFLTFWQGWPLAAVWAALPLALLAARRLARGTPGGVGVGVASGVLATTGGHPQTVLHVASITTVALVVELWIARSRGRRVGQHLGRAALAGALAFCLSAPVLLPFLRAVPETADHAGRAEPGAIDHSIPLEASLASARAVIAPFAGDSVLLGGDAGPARWLDAYGAFVGGLAFCLALGAVFAGDRRAIGPSLGALATFLPGIGFPVVGGALGALPGFSMAFNQRLTAATAFFLAWLACLTLESLASSPSRGLRVGLGALAAAWWVASSLSSDDVLEVGVRLHGVTRWAGPLSVLVCIGLASLPRRPSPGTLSTVALALLVGGRAAAQPDLYQALDRDLFYPEIPELEVLPQNGEPFRTVGLRATMAPGQSALWELEDARGVMVFAHARWADTFPLWCEPMGFWFCRPTDFDAPFLDFLNVRFLLTPSWIPAEDQPSDRWTRVTKGPHLSIWENRTPLPRAFAPRRVRVLHSHDRPRALRRLKSIRDFREEALLEIHGSEPGVSENGPASVETAWSGGDLRMVVRAERETWIVVSQVAWPGWRARTAAGQDLPLVRANHAFLAIRAPAGASEILLEYVPPGLLAGSILAALGLVGAGAVLVVQRRSGRWTASRSKTT